jgi:TonB family protein
LRGDSRIEDERALEKKSVKDPFLADAMEGYRQFPEGDHEASINRLHGKLHRRTDDRKGGFIWLRIAAAVAMIVIAGGVFWAVNQSYGLNDKAVAFEDSEKNKEQNAEEMPAMAKEDKKLDQLPGSERSEVASKDVIANIPDVKIERPVADNSSKSESDAQLIAEVKEGANQPPPPALVSDGVAMQDDAEVQPDSKGLANVAAPPVEETAVAEFSLDAMDAELLFDSLTVVMPGEPKYIVGTIRAKDQQPLFGVNIIASGTTVTALTDIDGQFKLEYRKGMEKLEFSYTGYEKIIAQVQGPGSLSVTMNQIDDLALSEVVVMAEPVRARAKKSFIGQPKVKPIGGGKSFEKYIEQNQSLPDANQKGEVLLQFVVDTSGNISNIKALQSSTKIMEEEAKRLLKAGPKWENKTGGPQTAEYTVKFEK